MSVLKNSRIDFDNGFLFSTSYLSKIYDINDWKLSDDFNPIFYGDNVKPKSNFTYDIVYTEHRGHAAELSKQACAKYNLVVAVGGDGTVNEVAKGLIGNFKIRNNST